MNATAKSGSRPEEQPAMMEIVPVGATVLTLQLRTSFIGRMRLPSASRAHVSSGPQIERAHSGNAPRSRARRSAQTALYKIADALARMLAPILVYTADEIWENLSKDGARTASVHLAEFPAVEGTDKTELLIAWGHIFMYRDQVLAELEKARTAKVIGSSLEARAELVAGSSAFELLDRYRDQLRYIFIVSDVQLSRAVDDVEKEHLEVKVSRAAGEKCERCWNYSTRVGESARYPTACERCIAALTEIEREEAA
jgi:isoleucyl-tRNA synthetase